MTSFDTRSRGASRIATVALITLALLAGTLLTLAAPPSRVLAVNKVIDVTLPVGRVIAGTILKAGAPATAAAYIRVTACLVGTTQGLCKSTNTAVNGTYAIKQLAPGKYTLEIDQDDDTLNFQSGWYTTLNSAHFTAGSASASQVDVTLGNKAGINSTIGVGFRISGVVHLGTSATSVAGVDVIVCSVTGFTCRFTQTAAAGVYSVMGLAPGQYTIQASMDSQNYVSGWFRTAPPNNFSLTSALATKLVITTASLTGKNMTLPVGFKIVGSVKTTANVAIPDAGVSANGASRYGTATTSATGSFVIQGLPAGSYKIAVTNPYSRPELADVYFKAGVTGQYTYDPAGGSAVVITTANKSVNTIWEPVGRTITGKITKGGVALANSGVTAWPTASSGGFFFFFGAGSASSALDGTWTIRGLRPATYRIGASSPYYPPTNVVGGYYRTGVAGNYTRNLEQGSIVNVTSVASAATLPLNLPAGNTITGTIKGAPAVALANASVTVYSQNNTEFSYAYATTALNGTYTIVGIPNGKFVVVVSAPYSGNYQDGYYRNAPTANFTRLIASATPVIFGDGIAPTITARAPAIGATGVSRVTNVTATFSEAVLNTTAATFVLRKAGTFTNIAAVVTYDAVTHKATLNPSATLAASTSYTVLISDVYDATGNQITATWTFKTGL